MSVTPEALDKLIENNRNLVGQKRALQAMVRHIIDTATQHGTPAVRMVDGEMKAGFEMFLMDEDIESLQKCVCRI